MRFRQCLLFAAGCLLAWFPAAFSVSAQSVGSGMSASLLPMPSGNLGLGVDVQADRLEYDADQHLLKAQGNVVIRQGADVMRADYVDLNTETQEAHARGHVRFEQEGKTWEGEALTYNFKTEQGDFGEFKAHSAPYYIYAKESKRISADEFYLKDITITTCEGDSREFEIHASEARIINGRILKAHHVVFYLGPVPFFYMPYLRKDLGPGRFEINVVPGYSSRMGAYLLGAFNYEWTPELESSTHLDLRSSRGVGVGQDLYWEATNQAWMGDIKTYYAYDTDPYRKADDETIRRNLIDHDRYRVRLSDTHNLSDRDYITTEINYLSDPNVIEDFFDEEFRLTAQPENRINLTHRGDQYTAGLLVNQRLNDFFENVNRTPEAFLDLNRQQLFDTPFYYEGRNRASYLKKEFDERYTNASYNAVRLDSGHMFYYPTRQFGFLNLIPRAGYEGTYYSKTYENQVATNQTIYVTNGIIQTNSQVLSRMDEKGAGWRNVGELGGEVSFKAFKVLTEEPIGLDRDVGLRHIAEPFGNYTFVPEPNLRPADLPQFDATDQLDKRNDVQFGIRNKLQTKRYSRVHDLVDTRIYTTYLFEKNNYPNDFKDIEFDARLRLVEWCLQDFYGGIDPYEGEFSYFNTQWAFISRQDSRLSVEYRYRRDIQQNLLGSELSLFPNQKWSFKLYGRYDIEGKEMQEYSGLVEHKMDCIGVGVGVRVIDNEPQAWLQIWILALPQSSIALGR